MSGKTATIVITVFCAASAFAGAEFASLAQAQSAFATNAPAVRERAYRYVHESTKSAGGRDASAWLQTLRSMAVAVGKVSEYDAVCESGLSSPDEAVRFASLMALAQSPSVSRVPADFAARLEKAARGGVALDARHRIEVLKAAADIRVGRLRDGKAAAALLDEAIGIAGDDAASVMLMRMRKLDTFKSAGMESEVEREAASLLEAKDCPVSAYASAAFALAEIEARRGNSEKVGNLILSLIRKGGAQTPSGVARRLIEANVSDECLSEAVDALRRGLAQMPLADAASFRSAVERVQPEAVEILNRLGRCDEALAECRVLVLSASQRAYPSAVRLTAETLKRSDGNLGRATEFMNFQKKGIVPKGRNVVMDAPRLSDAVRAEARASLPVGRCGKWTDSLAVSARLVWLDDPLAAMREAMRAFALAPFDGRSLQTCVDAALQPVLAATRDPAVAKSVVDYLMHGSNGHDGARGTSDDLPDPCESLSDVLKLGVGD